MFGKPSKRNFSTNSLIADKVYSYKAPAFYAASRALYGLSLEGRAPKILKRCTKRGVPIYCIAVTTLFPCLSFLAVSSGSVVVLNWLINLVTAGSLINFVVICITFLRFYKACIVQGVDRRTFPYRGWGQPYMGWAALTGETFVLIFFGYSSFDPPSVEAFFSSYTMLIVAPITYTFWKFYKKTKLVKPQELDLMWERPIVDAYEATFISPPVGFWTECIQMIGFKRDKVDDHRNSISA